MLTLGGGLDTPSTSVNISGVEKETESSFKFKKNLLRFCALIPLPNKINKWGLLYCGNIEVNDLNLFLIYRKHCWDCYWRLQIFYPSGCRFCCRCLIFYLVISLYLSILDDFLPFCLLFLSFYLFMLSTSQTSIYQCIFLYSLKNFLLLFIILKILFAIF